MGNKSSSEHAEVKGGRVNDPRAIYWDADGNLRLGSTLRDRDQEIIEILKADTCDDSDPTKLWMIVPSRWIKEWLLFAYHKIGEPPGPIPMLSILTRDHNAISGWRPKNGLIPPSTEDGKEHPGHYRRISLEAWICLYNSYGCKGYALAVRGVPFDDTTRWRVFKDCRNIDINLLPEPVIQESVEAKKGAATAAVDVLTNGLKSTMNKVGLGSLMK